jgi:hypothetical protein
VPNQIVLDSNLEKWLLLSSSRKVSTAQWLYHHKENRTGGDPNADIECPVQPL